MRVHITGVAGVLGSYLAELFTKMGFSVQGNDIVRMVTNVELAEIIRSFIPTLEYELGDYELGELINGTYLA